MRSEQKDLQSRTARAIRRDPAVNTRTRRDSRSPLHISSFFSSQFPPRTGTARIKYARHRPSCSRCRRRQAGRGRLSLTIQVKALCRPAQSHGWRSRRPPRLGRRLTSVPMEPRIRPACPCLFRALFPPARRRRAGAFLETGRATFGPAHEAHRSRSRTGTCGAARAPAAARHHTIPYAGRARQEDGPEPWT